MAAPAGHADSSKLVIYAALAGNLLIAVTKFVAAGLQAGKRLPKRMSSVRM